MRLGLKTSAVFTLGLVIIGGVGIQSYLGIQRVTQTNQWVTHTHQVLENLEHVLSALKDAETGQRGFVLTGDEHYLEPYNEAAPVIKKDIDTVATLTANNPDQKPDIQQLRKLSGDKLDELQETIKLRRESGMEAALPAIRSDRGKKVMDEIRKLLDGMEGRERQLLDRRNQAASEVTSRSMQTLALGVLLSLLVLGVAAVVVTRTMRLADQGPMSKDSGRKWPKIAIRYAFAVAMVALAAGVRWWFPSLGDRAPYIAWYPAVILVATIAGGGPGILATILSALAADYWFIPPYGQFSILNGDDAVALGILTGTGIFVSALAERLHRARYAEAVSATQERELALMNMAQVMVKGLDHRIIRWSEGNRRLYGFDTKESVGHLTHELLQTHFAYPLEQLYGELLKNGYWGGEVTRRTKDGRQLSVSILWTLRRGEKGVPPAILEVSTDITERKQAEAAVARLAAIVESSDDAIISKNIDGAILTWNIGAERIFGYRPEEIVGQPITRLLPPDRIGEEDEIMQRIKRSEHVEHFETVRLAKDGRRVDVSVTISPVKNNAGTVIGASKIIRDITEQKRAQKVLREQATLLTLAHDAIIVRDPADKVVFWNHGAEETYGWTPDEAVGQVIHDLLKTRFPKPLAEINADLAPTGRWEGELTHTRKDGQEIMVTSRWSMQKDEAGRRASTLEINRDITDRKRIEEALRQAAAELARSNEDLAQFASIASHDLQEPLRMIGSFLKIINEKYAQQLDDKAREYIGFAVDGAHRMSQLISDLLAYSRVGRQGKGFVETDMEAMLAHALLNLQISIGEAQAAITHDPLPTVKAETGMIVQLFQNLIGNAIKYRAKDTKPEIHVGAKREERGWQFWVRDNGIGIKAEDRDRVFMIFQRLHTRQEYSGTGIGLAICKRIIEYHGGRIWVESTPGEGSTFFFAIPDRQPGLVMAAA
jgi:PAS domain S-box-containing protein